MHYRVARYSAWLAAGALVVGCSETSLEPTRVAPKGASSHSSSATTPSPFHPNSQKYSNKGAKPATGRSGSAAMQTRALLGKDGKTTLEATTGTIDGAAGPGQFSKLQVKAVNGAGDAIRTDNYNGLTTGTWSLVTNQLGHNAPIQIQGNVRGIDGNRTDVVTTSTTVKFRPDIQVASVSAPTRAYVNTTVDITSVLREANGDVGATANCVLFIDGAQADQATGVWVDAGDAVSCAFSHVFDALGTHAIEVRATNVVPGDWDTTNNSAAASIEIVTPNVKMYWNSNVSRQHYTYDFHQVENYDNCSYYYYYYSGCSYGTNTYDQNQVNDNTGFWFGAYTYEGAAQFPVQVAFSASTEAAPIMAASGTMGDATQYDTCVNTYDGTTNTWGSVCSYPSWGYTSVNYQRYSGSATYYSHQHNHYWYRYSSYCYDGWGYYDCGWGYGDSGPYDNDWSSNSSSQDAGGVFAVGSTASVNLVLTDATGKQFLAGGSFAVSPFTPTDYTYNGSSCDYWYYSYCYTYTQRQTWSGVSGNGYGFGQQ